MSVYFIRAGSEGPVKIGVAEDVQKRVAIIQTHCPVPLEILRTVTGGRLTERWFHQLFTQQHSHGEWFHFVPEMLTAKPPVEKEIPLEGLVAAISAALKDRVTGKSGDFIKGIADRIGMDRGAVENWFYGNNLPSLSGWIALCQQLPGLQDEVLGDITGELTGGGERREQAERLRELADEVEGNRR